VWAKSFQPTATETPQPGTFYFKAKDDVTLSGKIVGTGTTALIFSAMDGDSKEEWTDVAPLLAARGYLTLAYDYRGVGQSQGRYVREQLDRDLRAAVTLAHEKGATKIVLIGSSLGGLVTLKVAATAHPAAIVALSAPKSFGGLSVTPEELRAIPGAKFLAAAERDGDYASSAQGMYSAVSEPKELHIYPGNAHGTNLFDASTDTRDFVADLLAVLAANAPPH
jgi:pimeloyl-ACP methyl ester carboxylesterase